MFICEPVPTSRKISNWPSDDGVAMKRFLFMGNRFFYRMGCCHRGNEFLGFSRNRGRKSKRTRERDNCFYSPRTYFMFAINLFADEESQRPYPGSSFLEDASDGFQQYIFSLGWLDVLIVLAISETIMTFPSNGDFWTVNGNPLVEEAGCSAKFAFHRHSRKPGCPP